MPLPSSENEKGLAVTSSRSAPYSGAQKITRSRHGCLTCRLRRKKCNEPIDHTVCDACKRLKIECLGYAPKRPTWLTANTSQSMLKAIRCFLAERGNDDDWPTLSLAEFYEPFDWTPTLERSMSELPTAVSTSSEPSYETFAPPNTDREISYNQRSSVYVPLFPRGEPVNIVGSIPPHPLNPSPRIFVSPTYAMEGDSPDYTLYSDEVHEAIDYSWIQSWLSSVHAGS